MNDNPEQRGEPAEASGLPFGTPNPANVTDADTRDTKSTPPKPLEAAPPDRNKSTTDETGDAGPHPEELSRRATYERNAD